VHHLRAREVEPVLLQDVRLDGHIGNVVRLVRISVIVNTQIASW
jgi:hypothetical protein